MAAPTTSKPKRRFAPEPIETTFKSYTNTTRTGPTAELTPEPSPRTASPTQPPSPMQIDPHPGTLHPLQPPKKAKRKFAPVLIESSRRSRRSGDVGPATKPTDKTDITPHTNHIYAPKHKRKQGLARILKTQSSARRESCDDEVAGHVFDLVAREAERKLQEVALSAFPNTHARAGGAEHFFVRDGSDDDHSRGRARRRGEKPTAATDSSEEEASWAVKEMQQHHKQLAKAQAPNERIPTEELDKMSLDAPEENTMWTTAGRSPARKPSSHLAPINEAPTTTTHPPTLHPISHSLDGALPTPPPTQAAPRTRGPFGALGVYKARDLVAERELHKLKSKAPPMLGKDLTFRRCPSPKKTKLEPDHLWDDHAADAHRDTTGENGLWNGYCYSAEKQSALAPFDRGMGLLKTPMPGTPADPGASFRISDEPEPLRGHSRQPSGGGTWAEHRARNGEAKGLHMLISGVDERLRKEAKKTAELEAAIEREFDDGFVTQVYNYLSLGYPAMARSYDEELGKISRMAVSDLGREDESAMGRVGARGFVGIEAGSEKEEKERCPRWRALRLYIHEWARQHPDLNNISPLAWGVRERRGSWGI